MSTTCTNLQQSLAWCQGTTVLPGVKRRIYYIAKSDIVSWPSLPKTNGKVTAAKYSGSFTLAGSAKWKYIDILPDKSQLTSEPQGEVPSQTQLNKLTAVHPGVDDAASAAALYINNTDCVFIVEDMNGKYRVVGTDMWQTKGTVSQDLGQGATGTASTTINIEATDVCPSPFYEGSIVTDDGTISGSSSSGSGSTSTTTYTVTATPSPSNGGTISGTGTYNSGSTATLTATPASGYSFVKWSDNNTTNPRTVTVSSNVNLMAIFSGSE